MILDHTLAPWAAYGHLSPVTIIWNGTMFIKKKLFTALALQGAGAITLLAIRTVIKFNHPAVIRKAIP